MVDVCTRYCVLRPLPNKQSDIIVKTLIQVFHDGFPRYFWHGIGNSLSPTSNGVAERWVQTSVCNLLSMERYQERHDSAPFSPVCKEDEYLCGLSNRNRCESTTEEELQERLEAWRTWYFQ
ncbi:hypothetical protein O0I10_009358 [Lichtheimia ornata]|uniref:Integrase catalytic domain-containing protein n=1 Tax=Lichtheimia ornata TaxID=688661 RepID=A0AAD7UYD7_9FUNG|nr:uncharacterized protein O0I10_009358 [Lichtheimia ornata]KAJ8654962.1 hypothetical protein O0I10_009358 [Lichtheimia ornata]